MKGKTYAIKWHQILRRYRSNHRSEGESGSHRQAGGEDEPAGPPDKQGRGVAIVQSLKDYGAQSEEQALLRDVVRGLMDLEEGHELSLNDVKKRLGLSE